MNWENDGEDEVLLGEDCEEERKIKLWEKI